MTVGETLLARVVEPGPTADRWRLSLVDIEIDDVAIPAPPILAGGPPWLIPPDDADDADDGAEAVADSFGATVGAADSGPGIYAPEPSVPAPQARDEAAAPVDPAVLQALTVERDQLFDELGSVREQRRTASKELETLRTEVRRASRFAERLQAENTGLRAELGRSAGDESLFTDPLEQLRFEVYQAWARRIPAAQKGELPLATWTVGPDFLDTLTMEALSRPKVVDVIVEVLTGLVYEVAGREAHQLRTGTGGDDPYRTRVDGATCWRVSLQVRSPSARRLHYWQLNDGSIELASIRLHDDFRT